MDPILLRESDSIGKAGKIRESRRAAFSLPGIMRPTGLPVSVVVALVKAKNGFSKSWLGLFTVVNPGRRNQNTIIMPNCTLSFPAGTT